MKLIYDATNRADHPAGNAVQVGDEVTTFRGEEATVLGISKPTHAASTGRVTLGDKDANWTMEYFPSVIGALWIDREDQV